MMSNNSKSQLIESLSSLVQLDIDAYFAYETAIEMIDADRVKLMLSRFKKDHRRHISVLSTLITSLGGSPPEMSRDLKGYLIDGYTQLRSVTGTVGTLKAMSSNEKLTSSTYRKALDWDLPPDIRAIVERNEQDEAYHLRMINRLIEEESRVGENVARQAS
jgi:uncharacterized protein (TIGR02284 family)